MRSVHSQQFDDDEPSPRAMSMKMNKCGNCGFTTKSQDLFLIHMRKHHQEGVTPILAEERREQPKDDQFKCAECEATYSFPFPLEHVKNNHVGNLNCPDCNYRTNVKQKLNHHMLINHEEFQPASFIESPGNQVTPSEHIPEQQYNISEQQDNIPEQQDIPEQRDQPDVTPTRKSKRKVIITDLISPKPKRVKTQAAVEFKCGECRKSYSRSDNLKRHMTKAHS
jgi:DNA-directed RNA polymerase subunit RPC12/RpoP